MRKPTASLTASLPPPWGLLSGPSSRRLVQGAGPARPWHHQGDCSEEDVVGSGEWKEREAEKGELHWDSGVQVLIAFSFLFPRGALPHVF